MSSYFEVCPPPENSEIPLITHIPHAATQIPSPWRESIVLSNDELELELLRMTDRYTDELFSTTTTRRGTLFINHLSRLVFDPERFPQDSDEPMSKKGMGAVYLQRHDGSDLRHPEFSEEERSQIIGNLFEPYAMAMADAVDSILQKFGRCVILDGHSFPKSPLPYEDDCLARPEICIGFDSFHCPNDLVALLRETCSDANLTSAANEPFAGSYVPTRHFGKDERVFSVMIEVRRDLYMNESDGTRAESFDQARVLIDRLAAGITGFLSS